MGNGKVIRSGIWYTISNFLLSGMSFITTPIFTRLLSKEEYGEFSNFVSWISILSIFITLNTSSSVLSAYRDYKGKEKSYTFSMIMLALSLAMAGFLAAFGFSSLLKEFLGIGLPMFVGVLVYIVCLLAIDLFQMWQRFEYKYKISVAISLSLAVLTNIVSIFLILHFSENRLNARYLGYIFPTIMIGIPVILYYFFTGKTFEISMWKYAVGICLPYIPHKLSLYVLSSSDRIMITRLCGAADNALYSIGTSVGMIISILVTAINSAYAPWLAEKMIEDKAAEVRKKSLLCMIGFSWLALGIMFCAPEVLYFMGGRSYMQALPLIAPVEMSCICQFVYGLYVDVEQISKKTKGMAMASLFAAVLNIILNMIFIPMFGYIAAAYTTLAGYIALLISHMFIVYKIQMSRYFSTGRILCLVGILSFITVGMSILYQHGMIRFFFFLLYIGVSVVAIYKTMKKLQALKSKQK